MSTKRATMATTAGTPRYALWLQKALRVRDETERFWMQHGAPAPQVHKEKEPCGVIPRPKPRTIWEAVEWDDAAEVKHLLETTPSLVFQRRETCASGKDGRDGGSGTTLLHEAAFHGSHQVVALVLHHIETRFPGETLRRFVGATDTVHSQTTPLIAACRGVKGDVKNRLKIVQLLIHADADVEHQDAHGDNAIHWCARTSNNVLLRWILKATDAGAHAVYAENYKREKPLDIAKRHVANATTKTFSAQSVYTSLRSVDRKCNVRLKMQVIKRHMTSLETERAAAIETQWVTALTIADDAIDATDRMWRDSLKRVEENRREAETAHAAKAAEAARVDATQWLDTKEGKAYLKKQVTIATEELKLEVSRGKITKPKDMKKAATSRASESYITQQVDTARKSALESWRMKRPPYPADVEKLVQVLDQL